MTGEAGDSPGAATSSLPARRREQVGTYYRGLDRGDYDTLAGILHEGFVHERPDMTLSGADRFVAFMREERPHPDTRHPIDAVFVRADGGDPRSVTSTDEDDEDGEGRRADSPSGHVAAQGRLLAADGREIAAFLDVFAFEGDAIGHLRTYTH